MSDHINQIRLETEKDLKEKLDKYGKVAVIRPTGWGKTWLLTDMIKDYNKVLYVYPTEVISNTVVEKLSADSVIDPETYDVLKKFGSCPKVTLQSYRRIEMLTLEQIKEDYSQYDLIIFDEAHRMMAKGTMRSLNWLFRYCKHAHIIGATASPVRTDPRDFVSYYFGNICVFPYTLHDAFQDGLLQIPYYCYCTTDMDVVADDLKREAFTAGEDFYKGYVKEVLNKQVIELGNLCNMEKTVKDVCTKYAKSTNYMKFIVFFSSWSHIDGKGPEVESWFRNSFPDHKINILRVTSQDEYKDNIEPMMNLPERDNTIDLIYCVEMLNMGYHVNSLTGIIMYRGTISDIIYIQQLGRGLSSGDSDPCIVIDVVDNLHRKAAWEMQDVNSVQGLYGKRRKDSNILDYSLFREASDEEKLSAGGRIEEYDGVEYILLPDEYFDKEEGTAKVKWWMYANNTTPEDFNMVSYMAEYKELIAKAVGESLSVRCLEALEMHVRRFCRDKNIPYPIGYDELKAKYGYEKKDIIEHLKQFLSEHISNYPINDAKKILTAASLPLDVFANWKKVSVKNILTMMGVA